MTMDTTTRQIGPQPPVELVRCSTMTTTPASELRYTANALRNLADAIEHSNRRPDLDAISAILDHAAVLDRLAATLDPQPPNVGPRPIRARHQGHRCPTP